MCTPRTRLRSSGGTGHGCDRRRQINAEDTERFGKLDDNLPQVPNCFP
jgi:hypothetical protein